MKIIQSFWTGKNVNSHKNFGWLSSKYHYLGWILSVNQLRKFYKDVILFTDLKGYEILIEKLRLPYTEVKVVLDDLNHYEENLWALAKVKAYSEMDEPFLHVDGDVFIWEAFGNELLNKPLIAQNIETTTDYYWSMWESIRARLNYLPEQMKHYDMRLHNKAYNMGIFGGSDTEFVKRYCKNSFAFVDNNISCLSKDAAFNFNIFFEQVLLYEMVKSEQKQVSFLIEEDIGDNEYKGFGNFEEVPYERKYLHLLGFFKRQELVCNKLDIYVQKYYPQYYSYLEDYLNITPKLSDFGFNYSIAEAVNYKNIYLSSIVNNKPINNKTQSIYSRNVLSEGMVTCFFRFIEKEENFYLIPLTNYIIDEDQSLIKVELIDERVQNIEMMNIDNVIFDVIKNGIESYAFKKNAIGYLDADFPPEEIKSYLDVLWKRISIFIALGIVYPLSIAKYQEEIGQ